MAISVSHDQVLSLAPDAASLKAARSLANPRPWTSLGRDDRAIWGACQGSAKDPYFTQVDWQGPAFKCSCPSRKFPCKHGLALLLLLADQPGCFSGNEPPEWIAAWLKSRSQRADSKLPKEGAPVDEESRAKRAEQRASRISQGFDELELWLRDLAGHGIASAPGREFDFWDRPAARLVDAQAPGAARRVRALGAVAASGEGWESRMLDAIAQLALLIQAWRRLDALPAASRADVRAAVGIPLSQEEVLATAAVRDLWFIAGQRVYQEDRIRVQRSWLTGATTGRTALILDFAAGTGGFKNGLLPGTVLDADLCFFPGAAPLRALVKAVHGNADAPAGIPGCGSISRAFENCGLRSSANPFTEIHPAGLSAVVPIPGTASWVLRDETGSAVPMRPDFPLVAISGGRPVEVFGEWDGRQFVPMMAAANRRLVTLQQVSGE